MLFLGKGTNHIFNIFWLFIESILLHDVISHHYSLLACVKINPNNSKINYIWRHVNGRIVKR